jgi:formylmethanofuran--tetrahydromethanopterin N-formyltransferase
MKNGILAVLGDENVLMVSAGNYEGQLGDHKIYLRELFR